MKKQIRISLRIDEEDERMLDILAKKTTRTKSDMFRFLIRQEFERGGYDLQKAETRLDNPCLSLAPDGAQQTHI
jgi:predicted DNA-binding protein